MHFDQAAIFTTFGPSSKKLEFCNFYLCVSAENERKMSSKVVRRDSLNVCVVCCEDIEFFAIGVCDHCVCYKCCVRMRVLGKEIYCPVCRTELKQVSIIEMEVTCDVYNIMLCKQGN